MKKPKEMKGLRKEFEKEFNVSLEVGSIHDANNYVEWLESKIKSLQKENEEKEELLYKILNSGDWFHSALEIDTYEGYDGKELEEEIKKALKK